MLLHNQVAKAIEYQFQGVTYKWDPHGARDVPDQLVEFLQLEGFPVAITPVTAQSKATQAADALAVEQETKETHKLRGQVEELKAKVRAAEATAKAAEERAAVSADAEAQAKTTVATLEEQLRIKTNEGAEYEKMIAEAQSELEAAKKRIGVLEQLGPEKPETKKPKG